MQKISGDIREARANVLVVSFAAPAYLKMFLEENPLPFPVVADPNLFVYRQFGLERTSWSVFFRPSVIARYLVAMWRGTSLKKPAGRDDLLQLGGDFVLDKNRQVVFAYSSKDPTDRPGNAQLLSAIHSAR